eukprot:scaffold475914_cov24-Prasinocladus_malaysianus.AAC.1
MTGLFKDRRMYFVYFIHHHASSSLDFVARVKCTKDEWMESECIVDGTVCGQLGAPKASTKSSSPSVTLHQTL